jgi:hypothetical protein
MTIKVPFVLGLLCAVFVAAGQSNTRDARIAGHVYSPDGQPLAGVVVTIESAQGNLNDQHELTSQDGSYAFARLEPGGYTITAFRSGLIGEIYGMTSERSLSPLNLRPEQSLDKIDFHLRTSPPIAEMPNEAIAAAYPQNLVDLGAVYGRFSADGTLLAIVTNGIATGDPEQVWLYNLQTNKLFAATETPVPKMSPMIRAIAWVGNTLYIDGDRTQSTRHFVVEATAEGAKEISVPPPAAQSALASASPGIDDEDGAIVGTYRVRLERRCHGCGPDLLAKSLKTSQQFTIESDLIAGNFVFDSATPIVFYPSISSWNGAIIAFNLQTRRSLRLDLPMYRFSALLAAHKKQNGFLLAYALTAGSCLPRLSPYGEDLWLLPKNIDVRIQKHPLTVCFVTLHDEE